MSSKIIKNYLPEISALKLIRLKPALVTINLTNQCNQNCIYCEIGQKHLPPDKDALKKDDLFWIIDEMANLKIGRIAMCGGEPFLFNGIMEVVAYAGRKNIQCEITSNGMTIHLLNEKDFELLKQYRAIINISIDSFQDNIQAQTRGASLSLTNALKSLEKLNNKGIPVKVLTAISKFNFHDLFESLIIAYKNGVKQLLYQPIIYSSNYPELPSVQNKSNLNVSGDQTEILLTELKKILQFEKNHAISTNVYRLLPWIKYYLQSTENKTEKWFFKEILNKFFCREIYAIIDISYDGGIQPCGLRKAKINIHENRQLGLLALWTLATEEIKSNISNELFYIQCNACCHHFSRNMLASVIKYPIRNMNALLKLMPLLGLRLHSRMIKKIKVNSDENRFDNWRKQGNRAGNLPTT